MKNPQIKCHAPEHDHRYEAAAIKAERQDAAAKPAPAQAPRKVRQQPDHAASQHSPVTEREAKLLSLRERDAIAYDGLMKGYQETRAIEDKLRNELDEAHNDTFQAKAHAQRLADALELCLVFLPWEAASCESKAREALAQYNEGK